MKIFRHPHEIEQAFHHNVMSMGNFDGVHLGHQHIIQTAKNAAEKVQKPLLIFTFEPHPVSFFKPDTPPFRITNFSQKMERLHHLGVDACLCMAFNAETASISATDFIENILQTHCKTSHIVVGYDCVFGHKRSGNAALLAQYSQKNAFALTHIQQAVGQETQAVSSSIIRRFIRNGEIESAKALLGHHVVMTGHVQEGQKLARTLNAPTANIALHDYVRPRYGVYAASLCYAQKWHPAVANIGLKPTVNTTSRSPLLEVHLLNQTIDLYHQPVSVRLHHFLRPEQAFDDINALKAQIILDIDNANAYFNQHEC